MPYQDPPPAWAETHRTLSLALSSSFPHRHTHREMHTHLPLPTRRTQAFISWAKYPCFLQSPSFLAYGHWDNYLLSFPLPLASGEESCVALVCIKYLSAYCTFSYPVSRFRSSDGQLPRLDVFATSRTAFIQLSPRTNVLNKACNG